MSTAIHRMVAAANAGDNPHVIARLRSGWAVLAERQVVRGYALLLPDPVVPHLNALRPEARLEFLEDMATIGETILDVTAAARINYEILGNLEPALHAHVLPRHVDEPETLRHRPIWFFDWDAAPVFDAAKDGDLAAAIRTGLEFRGRTVE